MIMCMIYYSYITLHNATPTKQLLLAVLALCIEADLMFDIRELIHLVKSQPNRLMYSIQFKQDVYVLLEITS